MNGNHLSQTPAWKDLLKHAVVMNREENHLRELLKQPDRLSTYSLQGGGIFYDFSRQRLDATALELLYQLAEGRQIQAKFRDMVSGAKVNTTENRAALHTAARSFASTPLPVDGADVLPEIRRVREEMKEFARKVHAGEITGSSGKRFRHVVVIGIGGSYLGTEFVARALASYADKEITLHYLSNVDIDNFGEIAARIDPEATLWIVISKSYTTAETMANENQAVAFMKAAGLDPAKHLATVTSKGSPGDDPSKPVLHAFHMFDFIGGRYSVTSAVGGLPLSLLVGYDRFERFLKGAEEMDLHAAGALCAENLPLTSALIGIWNNNFLGYPALGIIPYATPLEKLAPHIQQLYMESNGKSVTAEGRFLAEPAGVIVFGEPGTNAQHSFFQLAHQGRPFPIDFIGVVRPGHEKYHGMSKGVTNHQELWANLISQPMALALGQESDDPARFFPGNRPSSTLLIDALTPENIGRLLSFYEAKTVFEAFVWGINPFDQFGVELGKTLASGIRREAARKNQEPTHDFGEVDPISRFYLKTLFEGNL